MVFLGFGIEVSAFVPQQYDVRASHAKAFTSYGTSLDLFNGSTNNGATVGLWYRSTAWNQNINFFSDDTIRIAGKCLDASSGNNPYNYAKVHLWDCFGGSNQKWSYDT